MAVTDYNKTKKLDIDSVSGTPTVDKAQPVLLSNGTIDGFEDGDFTNNPTWNSVRTSDPTVQSTTVKNGNFSLEMTGDTGLFHDRGTSDINNNTTFSCWVQPGNVEQNSLNFFQLSDEQVHLPNHGILIRNSGNGEFSFNTRDSSGDLLDGGLGTVISSYTVGEWYRITINVDYNNSEATAKVFNESGTELGSVTLNTSGKSNLQYIGSYANYGAADDYYLDDVTYDDRVDDSVTGNGDIIIDFTNISGPEDIAVYDQNGNLLDYEIESLDTTAETGVLWVYNSWVRDGTTQAQVVYGDNSANEDRQNVTGTWGNSGQNAVMVQHLQDSPLTATDSTSNNIDGTVNGAVSTSGQFDGAASFDGTDDNLEFTGSAVDNNVPEGQSGNPLTVVTWNIVNSFPSDGDMGLVGYDDNDGSGGDGWFFRYDGSNQSDSRLILRTEGGNTGSFGFSANTGEFYLSGVSWDPGTEATIYQDDNSETDSISDTSSVSDGTELLIGRSSTHIDDFFDGDISEVRIYSELKKSAWWQAEYDASPKAGKVFFSQQAAESTVQTEEATFSQTISIKDEDVTEGFSQTLIIENENVPEQFTQDVAVKDRDVQETLDTDVAIQDKDVEQNFTQDVTIKDFDAEQTFSQDVSLQETDQQAQFNQDVILSAGNIEPFNNTVVIKKEDAEKQFSQDLILENANIPEQFTQDVAVKDKNVEVTFTQSVIVADKDVTEKFTQDAVIVDRNQDTFDNSVVIAKQPAPRAENPLKVKTVQDTQTFVETLKPTETNVELKELKRD